MSKLAILAVFTAFLVAPGLAQPQSSSSDLNPGFLPGTPMHSFEIAIERAEIRLAGLIGGPDLKAKAVANNAQERLAEANALAERNRSEAASKAVKKYEEAMNRSQQISSRSNNSELSEQIRNVSRNNIEQLEQVREKVPEQARQGIDRAIRNSERNGRPNLSNETNRVPSQRPEVPGSNQSPNLEGKKPNIGDRRPNQSLGDLNNSGNNREDQNKPDLDADTNQGLSEEDQSSDQLNLNEESDNENPPDGVGNQLP